MTRSVSWMYRVQGQECGPVSAAELKQLAKAGTIAPTDHVRPETLEKWSLASNVKGLFPEVVELVLDDSSANNDSSVATAASPPPLPVSTNGTRPPLPVPLPSVAPVQARVELLSPSVTALKAAVSDAVWKRLLQLQMPVSDDAFWIRLSAFRSRRKEPLPEEAEAKGFWKRASEKIASLAESAEIQTNRYLIASTDGRYWVTNQLAAVGEAWMFNKQELRFSGHWRDCELTIDLMPNPPDAEVEFVQLKINLSRSSAMRGVGIPNRIIVDAHIGLVDVPIDYWTCFPLIGRIKPATESSFFNPLDTVCQIGVAATTEAGIVFGEKSRTLELPFADIVAWRMGDTYLKCVFHNGGKLQYVSFAPNAAIAIEDDAATFIEKIDAATRAALDEVGESSEEPQPETNLESPQVVSTVQTPVVAANEEQDLSLRSLSVIKQTLQRECGNRFCEDQMLVAEIAATPLFGTPERRLLVVCRDDKVEMLVADPSAAQWQPLATPSLLSIVDRWFVEAAGGEVFELRIDAANAPIIAAISRSLLSPEPKSTDDHSLVLLTAAENVSDGVELAVPFRIHFGDRGLLGFEASCQNSPFVSFECFAADIGKKSTVWNGQYGIVPVTAQGRDVPLQLVASPATLIRIWETRELTKLQSQTSGISLGEMYAQYNEMRTQKFVTGIFGNYFLAQQRLELLSPLDNFIDEIESAPSGVLPAELETALIERLSILEISRNQLNRWLDRCTLMYPHQQAELTRRWLEEAFGTEGISKEESEKEAWRVHQQTRADLRQVQASMNRAMAEVGQNLNAIAFAFPEEVRCAALAATRRAASMAGTGAMVAAFAGMGGQMLMGLGRASVGDPIGIAMLGTVGLSLVGRHLEKTAQDTEKKIRIRAYGIQALQWWKVVLETASIMALESRHTIEQTQKAAMMRDRKILESMPREKLPQTQKRMASVMLAMLNEEVGNQFYEALPGSGVFGWHIVDHMSEMTTIQPKVVLKTFSGEVPGSLAIGVNNVRRNEL